MPCKGRGQKPSCSRRKKSACTAPCTWSAAAAKKKRAAPAKKVASGGCPAKKILNPVTQRCIQDTKANRDRLRKYGMTNGEIALLKTQPSKARAMLVAKTPAKKASPKKYKPVAPARQMLAKKASPKKLTRRPSTPYYRPSVYRESPKKKVQWKPTPVRSPHTPPKPKKTVMFVKGASKPAQFRHTPLVRTKAMVRRSSSRKVKID